MRDIKIKPFQNPIYVTRPLLPSLGEFNEKLSEIWRSQQLTNNGPQHQSFEKKLLDFLRVPYLSLFNNGTVALLIACKSLDLSGEVITTPFTFPATPHALTWNQIEPVFCDIDPVTMNIDVNKIESMITPRTTGILAVHTFGIPCDVSAIREIADKYRLKVIYDAAHAFGVEVDGIGIGNYGDVSMMSFHATKLFHTAEGGVLIFKDPILKHKIDCLKNFGIRDEEEVSLSGVNGKMNELQAALGLVVLDCVEEERKKRRELVDVYRSRLRGISGVCFWEETSGVKYNHACFVIQVDEEKFGKSRDYIYDQYKRYNVFTRKYYAPLCSEYPHYRHLPSSDSRNLLNAFRVVRQVLSLPLYGELSVSDIEKICDILIEIRDL